MCKTPSPYAQEHIRFISHYNEMFENLIVGVPLSEWTIYVFSCIKSTVFGFARSHQFSDLKVIHSKSKTLGCPDLPYFWVIFLCL